MVHYGKTHYGKRQTDELHIIVTGQDIESLRRIILSANLTERRVFFGLKHYIEENFNKE